MNLGFYYHITIHRRDTELFLPGYLAVFIESLAQEVDELVIFLHEAKDENEIQHCDTMLTSPNIKWVNLGFKTPAWHRSIFYNNFIGPNTEYFHYIDKLLVRSPSPLAPYFRKEKSLYDKIVYLVVGDYKESVINMKINGVRDWAVKYYNLWNHNAFIKALKTSDILVNSQEQYNKLKPIAGRIALIRTTTLSIKDIFKKEDSFATDSEIINILFTGRIVREKGLDMIVDACALLVNQGHEIRLNIAGMLQKGNEDYLNEIKIRGQRQGFYDINYLGMKKVGDDLYNLYRASQIYVIASINNFEGFPRTIWEALASSCPVIATTVGSIPYYLSNQHNAILIPPNDIQAIYEAIKNLISDSELRKKIIKNGLEIVNECTLEVQTKKLVSFISQ